ncbi:MAG: hypothetical protein OXU23_15830 [Candidatus Poribacteria bacterium]|nr:hypothetical protein [Candidatus Poribacteria bacterium]
MDRNDFVRDDEVLYRSVRGKYGEEYSFDNGKLEISSEAFRDRERKPSVDRAELKGCNPSLSKRSSTDGIVSLITADVRSIGTVKTKIQNADAIVHAVDVIYDPTPENPAHSKIVVSPEFFGSNNKQRNVFKLLQLALAELAERNGWTLEPSV